VKHVTAARVARHFKGMIKGPVERFELPNLSALNFLLHGALDAAARFRSDGRPGEGFSTALLPHGIEVKT